MRANIMGKLALFLVFCLLSIFLFAGNAYALMLEFSFEELVEGANTIIVGTVEESNSYWNDEENNIYTLTTVSVEDILKGSIDNETITIITHGGTVGDITQWVEDEPFFVKGDAVGLFLTELPAPKLAEMGLNNIVQLQAIKTPFSVFGLFQGKLPINDNLLDLGVGLSQDDFIGDVNLVQAGQSVPDRKLLPELQEDTINQVITSITPNIGSGGTGTEVTVIGSGFGTRGSNDHLAFYYKTDGTVPQFMASEILSWSDSQIRATVPIMVIDGYLYSAASGPVAIFKGGELYSPTPFTVTFGTSGWRWSGSSPVVTYKVNPAGDSARNTAVQAAANSWNNAGTNFTFAYGGITTKDTIGQDGENVVIWTELSPGVLGQASMFGSGGYITEADFAFNTLYNWSTSVTCPSGYFDVETVAVHEFGHWLHLTDLYGNYPDYPQDVDKVMFGIGYDGTTKRNLHAHDILGIQWIYGSSGDEPDPDFDLVVKSLTVEPSTSQLGTELTATIVIENQSTANVTDSFWLEIYLDRESAPGPFEDGDAWVRVEGLAAGATATYYYYFEPDKAGTYKAWAQVDSYLEISDSSHVYGPVSYNVESGVVEEGPSLLTSFASGTWWYSHPSNWERLSTSTAHALTYADINNDGRFNLVASFDSGTWYIGPGGNWIRLSTSTARAMTGDGAYLWVSFPSGTWLYHDGSWGRLTTSTARAITYADITGDGNLNPVFSFSSGTWYIDFSGSSSVVLTEPVLSDLESWSWVRLSRSTAMAMAGRGSLLFVSFPSGTWLYHDGSWGRLTTSTARAITLAEIKGDGTLNPVISFPSGTWYIDFSGSSSQVFTEPVLSDLESWSWVRLSTSTARALQRVGTLTYFHMSPEIESREDANILRNDLPRYGR